jgi:hypothetical protein
MSDEALIDSLAADASRPGELVTYPKAGGPGADPKAGGPGADPKSGDLVAYLKKRQLQ